jgi:hypothetical protein
MSNIHALVICMFCLSFDAAHARHYPTLTPMSRATSSLNVTDGHGIVNCDTMCNVITFGTIFGGLYAAIGLFVFFVRNERKIYAWWNKLPSLREWWNTRRSLRDRLGEYRYWVFQSVNRNSRGPMANNGNLHTV